MCFSIKGVGRTFNDACLECPRDSGRWVMIIEGTVILDDVIMSGGRGRASEVSVG